MESFLLHLFHITRNNSSRCAESNKLPNTKNNPTKNYKKGMWLWSWGQKEIYYGEPSTQMCNFRDGILCNSS